MIWFAARVESKLLIALGHKEIPAVVVEVSKGGSLSCAVLVENMARRHHGTFGIDP